MLFGKYDDLETGAVVGLAPPPDKVTGEYFNVVVMFGVMLACHCCLIGGSDDRYLGSNNGGCSLFSLSLDCSVVGGGASNRVMFYTVITLQLSSP